MKFGSHSNHMHWTIRWDQKWVKICGISISAIWIGDNSFMHQNGYPTKQKKQAFIKFVQFAVPYYEHKCLSFLRGTKLGAEYLVEFGRL